MSLPSLVKKKREETMAADMDTSEANASIKVVPLEDRKYKLVKGNSGYETITLKRQFTDGSYLIGLDDILKDSKKQNPKACFRFGVVCYTEESETGQKGVYCLGSHQHSIAIRSSDLSILNDGQPCLKPGVSSEVKVNSETESFGSQRLKNELIHDYYLVLCLKNSKNPEMIRYYKDKLPEEALTYSSDSYVAFFKGGSLLAKVSNIREGTYAIGVSLFMEAAVVIDLQPSVFAFKQEVETTNLENPEFCENSFNPQIATNHRKAALEIANLDFSKFDIPE